MHQINKSDEFINYLIINYSNQAYKSSGKAYDYIKNELQIIQNYLCAYTELDLSSSGEIEHWDSKIKHTDGYNPYNIFYASAGTNRNKGTKTIYKLKPNTDSVNLICFNTDSFEYEPNFENFDKEICQDIINLGINETSLKRNRRNKLSKYKERITKENNISDPDFKDFPTAVKVIQAEFQKTQN